MILVSCYFHVEFFVRVFPHKGNEHDEIKIRILFENLMQNFNLIDSNTTNSVKSTVASNIELYSFQTIFRLSICLKMLKQTDRYKYIPTFRPGLNVECYIEIKVMIS